jgi:hypothetical protein
MLSRLKALPETDLNSFALRKASLELKTSPSRYCPWDYFGKALMMIIWSTTG